MRCKLSWFIRRHICEQQVRTGMCTSSYFAGLEISFFTSPSLQLLLCLHNRSLVLFIIRGYIFFHTVAVRLLSRCMSPCLTFQPQCNTKKSFLPSTSESSCHSNTVITSSFFTANEKVKYERLATAVICDPGSLPAGGEKEREGD